MEKADIVIIGAGVIGLAVARVCADWNSSIIVIEKNLSFGCETSSRNSEVVHASIYYPENSLKGRLCLAGNEMIYDICSKNHIPISNSGKLIVALDSEDEARLEPLLATARKNGAKGVRIISGDEAMEMEPNIFCKAALLCPSTGFVDTHALMSYYEADAISKGACFVYGTEVTGLINKNDYWIVKVRERNDDITELRAGIVINCAGLYADRIASFAGIDIDKQAYRQFFRKGMYFRVTKKLDKYPQKLIYPMPTPNSVGVHTVPDLAGGMRLGPHFVPVENFEYSVDNSWQELFYNEAKKFLPFLEYDDIQPDMSGIHPELYTHGSIWQDFIIKHESELGCHGFINLVGMGSPGLTASPAIGEMVSDMVKEILGENYER